MLVTEHKHIRKGQVREGGKITAIVGKKEDSHHVQEELKGTAEISREP